MDKRRTYKPVSDMQMDMIGKIPPQALDLEEAVLGAMMLERGCVEKIITGLSAKSFYRESNQLVYGAIIKLFDNNSPIDILTVTQQLKKTGELDLVGGPYYISQLTNRVASAANIEFHARIVLQKFIQRELIRVSTEIVKEAYEETADVLDLLGRSQDAIGLIGIDDMQGSYTDSKSRMKKTIDAIKKGINDNGVTGVPSGIEAVDKFTGGFQNGDLVFIGARPGNFKTGLAMAFAHKMVPMGFTPFIAQQEMGEIQSGMREIAMHSGVDTQDLRRGKVTEDDLVKIEAAADLVSNMSIYIDHTGGMSLSRIKAKVKKQNAVKKIDILFIDYLQLLEMEIGNRQSTEESIIAKTTRKLKLTAKELNIPIVALSQLNRDTEKNPGKRPTMSNLKGSGAIEADADAIILLFNPSKYSDDPTDENGNSLKNKIELIFCKNRQGDTGSVWLNVNPGTNTFDDDAVSSPLNVTADEYVPKPMPRMGDNPYKSEKIKREPITLEKSLEQIYVDNAGTHNFPKLSALMIKAGYATEKNIKRKLKDAVEFGYLTHDGELFKHVKLGDTPF